MSSPNIEQIQQTIHRYILAEFLQGEDPENLTVDLSLIDSGILDSVATQLLVGFLEETFNITVEPHEQAPENLESIESISALIASKL